MKDLIILGAGGAGLDIVSIVKDINKIHTQWNILGFLDDNESLIGSKLLGCNVLGPIDSCVMYPKAFFVSSIAHPNNRLIRRKIYEKVKEGGGIFATIIHPSVILYADVEIGEGSVINANVVIGSKASLGIDVHLGYGCNIGHETIIKDHSSFGTGVNLSSGVVIGENCYIGCGVSSTHDISINPDTLVTVGSSVINTLKSREYNTWMGNPAEDMMSFMRKDFVLTKLAKKD